MNAKRLTLIRRACNAIETAMQRNAFGDAATMDYLRAARRHLKAARNFVLNGNGEFATIEMQNAATHMRIILGVAA